jgi:CheY-like chemotaxis protein
MKSISAYGIEIKLLSKTMDSIIDVADKHPQWKLDISDKDKKNVIQRAQKHYKLFEGASILWFDDRSETLVNEIKMFSQLGVDVEVASTLEDVLVKMKNQNFDIVISDIDRGSDDKNGVETLKEIVKNGYDVPTIFYIGEYLSELGTPPYAFGITNRPDELLHLVIDILERKE